MIDEHPMMGAGRKRLEGKVAIVTADDSGIGRAAARLFAGRPQRSWGWTSTSGASRGCM